MKKGHLRLMAGAPLIFLVSPPDDNNCIVTDYLSDPKRVISITPPAPRDP